MTEEQKAAYIMAQAAILNATVAGMVAENQSRDRSGLSPSYREDDFARVVHESKCTHNDVLVLFS